MKLTLYSLHLKNYTSKKQSHSNSCFETNEEQTNKSSAYHELGYNTRQEVKFDKNRRFTAVSMWQYYM